MGSRSGSHHKTIKSVSKKSRARSAKQQRKKQDEPSVKYTDHDRIAGSISGSNQASCGKQQHQRSAGSTRGKQRTSRRCKRCASRTKTTPAAAAAVDEEGLRLHYDVILCGTGLVQAVLASALARAGQSVLHVDGNDYYGGLEAAWTLPYLTVMQNHHHDRDGGGAADLHREFRSDTLDDRYTYGEDEEDDDDATVLLPLHREGSNHSLRFRSIQRHSFPVSNGSHVQTAYGRGRVLALEPRKEEDTAALYYQLTIELTAWKLADGSYPKVHVGVPASRSICIHTIRWR